MCKRVEYALRLLPPTSHKLLSSQVLPPPSLRLPLPLPPSLPLLWGQVGRAHTSLAAATGRLTGDERAEPAETEATSTPLLLPLSTPLVLPLSASPVPAPSTWPLAPPAAILAAPSGLPRFSARADAARAGGVLGAGEGAVSVNGVVWLRGAGGDGGECMWCWALSAESSFSCATGAAAVTCTPPPRPTNFSCHHLSYALMRSERATCCVSQWERTCCVSQWGRGHREPDGGAGGPLASLGGGPSCPQHLDAGL